MTARTRGVIRCGEHEVRVRVLADGERIIDTDPDEVVDVLASVSEEERTAFGLALAKFFRGSNEALAATGAGEVRH